MGSGGSVQAMITILKNNEKIRSKREKFKRSIGRSVYKQKPEYDFPEATQHQLRVIRRQMNDENEKNGLTVILITAIIVASIITSMAYFIYF